MAAGSPVLVIACGALAREIVALKRLNGWEALAIECLPPELHNRPEKIPGAVREAIQGARGRFNRLFVAYADCGTGGLLDRVLEEEGVARLPGAHCYDFFATPAAFAALADEEPGTFYLTDFLVRHFERLVIEGLGLDRHPELRDEYFRHYRRLIHLVQVPSPELRSLAEAAAQRLGLAFEERHTGYGDLATTLGQVAQVATQVNEVVVPLAALANRHRGAA